MLGVLIVSVLVAFRGGKHAGDGNAVAMVSLSVQGSLCMSHSA